MLVPLAASGHYHAAHASTSCVTCSVAQHTPFVDASIVSMPGGTRFVVDLEVVPAGAPAGPSRREPTSRGPPALLLVHGT